MCTFVVACILFVAGCGPNAETKPAAKPVHADAKSSSTYAKQTVSVAAASDLQFAFDELKARFELAHLDTSVDVTYGSSGKFFAQLTNRAPFDLFLSADVDFTRQLIDQGLAIGNTQFTYAIGHLVVWIPKDSPLEIEQLGMEALLDPAVRKIAIANPKFAPYGRAAEAALKSLGVYEKIQDRLVLGENIAQTAQFVETGAADAGLIAKSLALAPTLRERGRTWPVPESAHPPLEQAGVILSWVKHREAADTLREFITSKEGRAILEKYGFGVPDP